MLDIKLLRDNEPKVRAALAARHADVNLDALIEMDRRRRVNITEVEKLKGERNRVSKEVGALKKAGQDTAAIQAQMRAIGERIAALDEEVRSLDELVLQALLLIPNIPHASTPLGSDATQNPVVRTWGEQRTLAFDPKPHWELGQKLGLFDFERGAKVAGSGFPLFVGQGARLQRALIQFMLDLHTRTHGYTEVLPPFMCNAAAMTGTGQLPKFAEDMYQVPLDGLYPVPTAEVPVTNLLAGEILTGMLPIKLTAYTPCFRREAGAAGRETRGLIRVHQFDKVELVKFAHPDTSYEEHESLTRDAEDVLQRLGLPYRVIQLCTGDIGFSAAKCYDLELWAPGQKAWLEVSSCSNFEDFQARRANIRFRTAEGKTAFVHTLNGSGVALPRLVVALLENGQQADGTVDLPEAIWPYMDGKKKLEPGRGLF